MRSSQNTPFIKFNNRPIYFISKDGQYWLPVRPICEALGLKTKWQLESIKKDEILNREAREHRLHDTSGRRQNMVCLPERYIYGWLFSIKFSNTMSLETKQNLITYKDECYNILFNHFHGVLAKRQEILVKKQEAKMEMAELEKKIKQNEDLKRLEELKKQARQFTTSLRGMDEELVSAQYNMFNN